LSARPSPPKRWPPFVVAAVLAVLGHHWPAALLVGIGVGLIQLDAIRPAAGQRADAGLAAFASALARAVGGVALTLVWALLLVPAALIGRLFRIDGLGRGAGWAGHPSSKESMPTDAFGPEPRVGLPVTVVRRLVTVVPLALGWLVIAVAANYAIGWLWDDALGSHDTPAAVALDPTEEPAVGARRVALADQPEAMQHLTDYQSLDYRYRPFLMVELVDGAYGDIVVGDGRRRTYEPPGLPLDAPEIWVFGGSTAFGKGQRDDHTVASELARLAHEAGTPTRVVNFGNPAYTSYQEWQLFERQLAHRSPPRAAVFLDGTADVEVQLEAPTPEPTHFNRRRLDRTLTGGEELRELDDLGDRYLDDSLIGQLWQEVEDLVGMDAAGADGPSIADNAADLGARARLLTNYLGERDGVPVVFVREPTPIGGPGRSAYRTVTDRVAATTDLDLSGLLDGRDDLYLDWIHVNEVGAAMVAAALFEPVQAYIEP